MMRSSLTFVVLLSSFTSALAADPPRVVSVPPADAGRGLVRVSNTEIRHYGGKGGKEMLVSTDNGETWNLKPRVSSMPPVTCLTNESYAIGKNPNNGEYITFEPLFHGKPHEGIYISKGGIDGTWSKVVNKKGDPVFVGGILRNPIWVNNGKRILIPAHKPGHHAHTWTWYSDDQGQTWKQSEKVTSPAHKKGGIHEGVRWNHGMVEATLIELKNGKIWMVARTAQDQHYESFSSNNGKSWSKPKPSRFYGTITMPTFHRMKDGRLLFVWSNTTSLPELERATGTWEDVFTNRDSLHAAISEDDGKTWIGFRELILDGHRGNSDYATAGGRGDRGKHQAEVEQLDQHRVLVTSGQNPRHRKLLIMDVRWLYESERKSNLADGADDWSCQQYIAGIKGHASYNRKPGAQVEDGKLRVLRVDDSSLLSPNQGAVWNFPAGLGGGLRTEVTLEEGGAGMQISLCDRWFNPTDHTVDQQAVYTLTIDGEGKLPNGRQIMKPGTKHMLQFVWKGVNDGGRCTLTVDGKKAPVDLTPQHKCPNGISYIHFYNPAEQTDTNGFSIHSTHTKVFPVK